jgi:RNA polymerase sigma-70 factor (ECF subfamily)
MPKLAENPSTSPSLICRLGDWTDRDAWFTFVDLYDGLIQQWCRRYCLSGPDLEELRQAMWVELAGRMRTYEYDPGKSFRGWLRTFCHSRALDHLRRTALQAKRFVPDPESVLFQLVDPGTDGPELSDSERDEQHRLLEQAEAIQQAARGRVKPVTWQAFWMIAVEGYTVFDASEALGISYASAFAARQRVTRMLRIEAQRPRD